MLSIFVIAVLASQALSAKQTIIPCAVGFGRDNGCGSCDRTQSITFGSWANATGSEDFYLEDAGSESGVGYDVYWNVEQPPRGCRTLLFEPYSTDEGSLNPNLKGNVVLSTNHGGCYFTNVGSRGILAGTCCNGDCMTAGGVPTQNLDRKRRSITPRQWSNSNPFERPPKEEEPPEPKTTCKKADRKGFPYTKAGAQVVSGKLLNCKNNLDCEDDATYSVVSSSSITNSQAITRSEGGSASLSMTAGFQILPIGPSMEITTEISKEWSEAISEGMSLSEARSTTKEFGHKHSLRANLKYHGWFTPTFTCYAYTMECTDGKDFTLELERCDPQIDSSGQPSGEYGVMVIG